MNDQEIDPAPGTPEEQASDRSASSFAKPLFCDEVHEDPLFPYHVSSDQERAKVRT